MEATVGALFLVGVAVGVLVRWGAEEEDGPPDPSLENRVEMN